MLTIKITTEDILNGKFKNTISKINGYRQESKGDKEAGTSYSASGVYGRMCNIKDAFEQDLVNLAKDLHVDEQETKTESKPVDNKLNEAQIQAVVSWLNEWEQLKDTVIPIRFEEAFRQKTNG